MKIHVQHVGANRSLVRFYLYEHLFQLDRHHLIDQDCEGVFWYTYTGMHLVHRHLIYSRHLMIISFVVWFIILMSSRPFTQNSPPFLYTHVFSQKNKNNICVSVCVTSCTKNVQSLRKCCFSKLNTKPLKQIVRLRSGSSLQCDIVVVGAGAIPNVDFCPPELGKPRWNPGSTQVGWMRWEDVGWRHWLEVTKQWWMAEHVVG